MRKAFPILILSVALAIMVSLCCFESVFAQLRVPSAYVAPLTETQSTETQPAETLLSHNTLAAEETETVTIKVQHSAPATPIQHVVSTQAAHPQLSPQTAPQVVPQPQAEMALAIQPQLQVALPPQAMAAVTTPGVVGNMTAGAIIVPVTVPQYMTYTPQPVTMLVNRPAQLVIPPYQVPMQAPMQMPMYDPMAIQMMQQQMAMQQQMMMPPPQMMPQQMPQQPIPIKMILPDGSTVSIKHYVPGKFFRNAVRAVTP